MVLRAKEPKRSAISWCAGPKTRRKSLARNLPNFLAASAVIAFTDHLQDAEMLSFSKQTGRRKTPVGAPATCTQAVQPDCATETVCPRRREGAGCEVACVRPVWRLYLLAYRRQDRS